MKDFDQSEKRVCLVREARGGLLLGRQERKTVADSVSVIGCQLHLCSECIRYTCIAHTFTYPTPHTSFTFHASHVQTSSSETVTVLGPGNMTLPSEPHPPKLTNHIAQDIPMSDQLEPVASSSREEKRLVPLVWLDCLVDIVG